MLKTIGGVVALLVLLAACASSGATESVTPGPTSTTTTVASVTSTTVAPSTTTSEPATTTTTVSPEVQAEADVRAAVAESVAVWRVCAASYNDCDLSTLATIMAGHRLSERTAMIEERRVSGEWRLVPCCDDIENVELVDSVSFSEDLTSAVVTACLRTAATLEKLVPGTTNWAIFYDGLSESRALLDFELIDDVWLWTESDETERQVWRSIAFPTRRRSGASSNRFSDYRVRLSDEFRRCVSRGLVCGRVEERRMLKVIGGVVALLVLLAACSSSGAPESVTPGPTSTSTTTTAAATTTSTTTTTVAPATSTTTLEPVTTTTLSPVVKAEADVRTAVSVSLAVWRACAVSYNDCDLSILETALAGERLTERTAFVESQRELGEWRIVDCCDAFENVDLIDSITLAPDLLSAVVTTCLRNASALEQLIAKPDVWAIVHDGLRESLGLLEFELIDDVWMWTKGPRR